jgi:hypothetical protein
MDLRFLWIGFLLTRACVSLPVDSGGTARDKGAGRSAGGGGDTREERVDLEERLSALEKLSEVNLIRRLREVKNSVQGRCITVQSSNAKRLDGYYAMHHLFQSAKN